MQEWLSGYTQPFYTNIPHQYFGQILDVVSNVRIFWQLLPREVCSQKQRKTNSDTSRICFNIGCTQQNLWVQYLQSNYRNKNMLLKLFKSQFVVNKFWSSFALKECFFITINIHDLKFIFFRQLSFDHIFIAAIKLSL